MENRIKELRKLAGLSQEELAEKAGTNKVNISRLERGERGITQRWMERLAPALGVEPHEIIYGPEYFGPDSKHTKERQAIYKMGFMPMAAPEKAVTELFSHTIDKIPVWGIVNAQDGEKYAVNTEDTPIDWISPLPSIEADKGAFAVLISGESMIPKVNPGHIAYVDSRKPPIKGEMCAVLMKDGSALIKNYLGKSDKGILLEQLNPHKEILIKLNEVERVFFVTGVLYR